MDAWERTRQMIGVDALDKLKRARVAVFGIGGVGGACAEALARGGIGALDLIDKDTVSVSNLNRQIFATAQTVGMPKVEAAKERLLAINPDLKLTLHQTFYLPETADAFDFSQYDYIVDAVDTVTAKLELAIRAKAAGVPMISAMGAGNKLDATAFQVADIYETSVCPLAKVMRRELKSRGIQKLKVVYSKEEPFSKGAVDEGGRRIPASISFVPPVAGLILAGEVIKDIAELLK